MEGWVSRSGNSSLPKHIPALLNFGSVAGYDLKIPRSIKESRIQDVGQDNRNGFIEYEPLLVGDSECG